MAKSSDSRPAVSVVMPVRNAAATLVEAIDSLRAQDFRDLEIVLVDHDSSDESPAMMDKAAQQDARIRVFRGKGTFVEAANLAWRQARGALIARMDSDDVAREDRIGCQVEYLEGRPDLAACGTLVNILKRTPGGDTAPADGGYRRYETWINSIVEPAEIAAQRFVDSPLPNPSTMIRRSALEAVGGYRDPAWAEDYDLWLRLLEAGYRLGKVPLRLLDWYDGESRATRRLERYSASRFQEAKAHYLSRMPRVKESGVAICGAGPIGKRMASLLKRNGVTVHAFAEVNERQIGNRIAGTPVVGSGGLVAYREKAVVLGAVGQPGGRRRVAQLAQSFGFVEGLDFFSVA
ncbi:MAG: glycosyltransferase [Verrucomicrobiales bacterium]